MAADKPDSPGVVVMPPAVFFFCLLAGAGASAAYGWYGFSLPLMVIGGAVAFAGFVFMGWAHRRFTTLGVAMKTVLPASRLVTSGAYRLSRNPVYVGFVAILAGLGLAAGSIPMLAGAVLLFLYFQWYVIPREEKYLARRFGDEYRAYCAKVRRWL